MGPLGGRPNRGVISSVTVVVPESLHELEEHEIVGVEYRPPAPATLGVDLRAGPVTSTENPLIDNMIATSRGLEVDSPR